MLYFLKKFKDCVIKELKKFEKIKRLYVEGVLKINISNFKIEFFIDC